MSEIKWLNRARVEFIHELSIEIAGGSQGLRDSGLLDSAIARPRNLHAYGETDMFQIAASYAEALSQNHPFVDGNKRVAFSAAETFLDRNGIHLEPSKGDEHADMIEALAQGKITRDQAANHLKEYSRSHENEKAPSLDKEQDGKDKLREFKRKQAQKARDRKRNRSKERDTGRERDFES